MKQDPNANKTAGFLVDWGDVNWGDGHATEKLLFLITLADDYCHKKGASGVDNLSLRYPILSESGQS